MNFLDLLLTPDNLECILLVFNFRERKRAQAGERGRGRERERERERDSAGSMLSVEPDVELDPITLGS